MLRLRNEPVDLGEVRRQRAGREGSGAVGAVAVDDASHVDRDERSLLDDRVAGMRMRPGAVLAGRDDGAERERIGTVLTERPLDPPRELGFGASHERLVRQCRVDRVRDRSCPTDRTELDLVLDRAQSLDETPGRNELRPARADRLPLGERDARGLEPDPPAGEQLGERTRDVATGLDELDVLDRTSGFRVTEIGVERRRASRLDEQCAVGALEARQVPDVGAVRYEQRVVELRSQATEATHSLRSARRASASR